MKAQIGSLVLYVLSQTDADAINERRKWVGDNSGNPAEVGQVYPAVVVRTWYSDGSDSTCVNLKVLLDGTDSYWATSRSEDLPGKLGSYHKPGQIVETIATGHGLAEQNSAVEGSTATQS